METEVFFRTIGCQDCQETWRAACPVCKKTATSWRDSNGRNVPSHQLTEDAKNILRKSRSFTAVIPKRVINPPIKKIKKKIIQKPEQPTPITIDNFFISTKGEFQEIYYVPDVFEQFFKSKGSTYYKSPNNEFLIRVSDHWGSKIRFCDWYLKGYPKNRCGHWKTTIKRDIVKIGLIKISDLEAA